MPEIPPKLSKTHPVPQHIAAFEFKLIGDLTIKQFLFAGVGVAVAYAAWISDLNFFLKWTTIILSLGLGLGTAFFPIQDRTLDQWLLNFVAALFSPTQRVWHKEPLPPEYLREDYSQFLTSQVLSMTPLQSRRRLQQYLGGLEKEEVAPALEEKEFVEKLNFDVPLPTTVAAEPAPKIKPPGEEKKDRLPERKEVLLEPKLASEVNIALQKTYKIPTEGEVKHITILKNITPGRKVRLPTIEGTIRLRPEEIKPLPERKLPPPTEGLRPTVKELVKEIKKPEMPPPRIAELEKQNLELKARLEEAERQLKSLMELKKELAAKEEYRERVLEQEKLVQKLAEKQKEAQKEIAKVTIPVIDKKIPNIISGTVKDREGKILENVVVIIKDQDGDPVRALKTNKLGQFAISTPLENSDYTIEVSSKEKYFDIMKITADGSILPPLEFREKYG